MWSNINQLSDDDIGKWVVYQAADGITERGKIKSFDNNRHIAWVVYKANGNWDADHWKDYTAQSTHYDFLYLE